MHGQPLLIASTGGGSSSGRKLGHLLTPSVSLNKNSSPSNGAGFHSSWRSEVGSEKRLIPTMALAPSKEKALGFTLTLLQAGHTCSGKLSPDTFSYSAPSHNQAAPASWTATTVRAGVGGLRIADICPSLWAGSGSF